MSKPVVAEYRYILTHPPIVARYAELTPEKVELALRRMRYFADVTHPVKCHFDFPRNPRDAKFIELAIAAKATHLVSGDNDLLGLPSGQSEASRRFRQRAGSTRVVDAGTFLNQLETSLDY